MPTNVDGKNAELETKLSEIKFALKHSLDEACRQARKLLGNISVRNPFYLDTESGFDWTPQ